MANLEGVENLKGVENLEGVVKREQKGEEKNKYF